MKPFKAGVPFSKWLLRISLIVYLIAYYHDTLLYFDFLEVSFVFALVYVLSAVALLIGGFKKEGNITVFSSLILLIAIGFNLYLDLPDGIYGIVFHILPLSVAFYFLSNGNK